VQHIHPTAIVDPKALIGKGTTIGSYCVIGEDVVIGCNNTIESYVLIDGHTTIGDDNHIGSYSAIGTPAQDIRGEDSTVRLCIGDGNQIAHHVLLNTGTHHGGGVTSIGDHNSLEAFSHVGHDVQLGSGCTLCEKVALGGHVNAEDHVSFGKDASVHQFVKIGSHASLGSASALTQDLPPFCRAEGNRAKITGINPDIPKTLLDESETALLKEAYTVLLLPPHSPVENAERFLQEENPETPTYLSRLYTFIIHSQRGIPFKRSPHGK